MPLLLIEISVASAGVDRAVTDADVRQTSWIIRPDRNVAGGVNHPIVDAVIPPQSEKRSQIAEAGHRVAASARHREANGPQCAGQRCVDGCLVAAERPEQGHGRLPAEDRRLEYVRWKHETEIGGRT